MHMLGAQPATLTTAAAQNSRVLRWQRQDAMARTRPCLRKLARTVSGAPAYVNDTVEPYVSFVAVAACSANIAAPLRPVGSVPSANG